MAHPLEETSFLFGTNSPFIEGLYVRYLEDPAAVDDDWRSFFDGISAGEDRREALSREEKETAARKPVTHQPSAQQPVNGTPNAATPAGTPGEGVPAATLDSIRALMMIRAYRVRGHLIASLDPLGLEGEKHHPELDPLSYGFSDNDYDRPIFVDGVLGLQWATLREMLTVVKQTYCGRIGVEFMHIQEPNEKTWIQLAVESSRNQPSLSKGEKLSILRDLDEAEGFERFVDIKYKGAKRFSLEGSESVVPALETIIDRSTGSGVEEIVIGMAHRGRLNVLTSIMGKSYAAVFSEFQGATGEPDEVHGSGDVKYHLGASADREFEDGRKVHISLTPNPSHLEAVNPVVLGKVRAKQTMSHGTDSGDAADTADRLRVMGILLHGDAAFAGQGLVSETFELSALRGYRTCGTVHIVINNQIGFTTNPSHARSSPYCSDIAKSVQAPIFHVNGDDPEAVVHVCRLAVDYRQKFSRDVVVDIFCYRRHGHNETDEPAFTQPIMYRAIRDLATTRQQYTEQLINEGVLSATEADQIIVDFRERLEAELEASKDYCPNRADWLQGDWAGMEAPPTEYRPGETAVSLEVLNEVSEALCRVPDTFNLHPRLKRLLGNKQQVLQSGKDIDWATGEALAFGTLLMDGNRVRLSGQDVSRGTFSQRHAAFFDQETEERYIPMNHVCNDQAELELIDSMLSEAGVLGYEYGFSIADPKSLVLWEAQFGDFANGAQMIIDQFIAPGEMKWLRMSGLVMLLPHGYEGQGPEHSSARLERYLQLFAEDNIQVANCSTPANFFHVLRRQMRRNFRKPLIVMSPKSLLRHKLCVSQMVDFGPGTNFHRVIGETGSITSNDKVRRVVLCSGKVYYDLLEARTEKGIDDVALIRVEQIAPFPNKSLTVEFAKYPNADVVWCQEEPKNMGAWTFVAPRIEDVLAGLDGKSSRPIYTGRVESASTATGFFKVHMREQNHLVATALGA
ncbi:MAG: 2-oxoglutarate dehydrogenase E1 component [Alphaproteobacteria bacterium]|jgi:2-oxoglutarate dehydrogenase E1 component|nr:2-oxoglutarate dehydrogenase E1 component [Alphaproteobacteria bacterium]